jgi:hypothetical protein
MPDTPEEIRAVMHAALREKEAFGSHEEIVDTVYEALASKNMLAIAELTREPREGLTAMDGYDIGTFPADLRDEMAAGIRKHGSMEAWARKELEEATAKSA